MAEFLFILLSLIFLGITIYTLILIFYSCTMLFVWPPSIPTDRKTRKLMIEVSRKYLGKDDNIKIADLGSGYGHLMYNISKAYPNAKITGYEILWLPYLASKQIAKIFYPNIKVVKGDIFKQDLSENDAIFFFFDRNNGFQEKFEKELKKGTIIISNNFKIKGWEPIEVFEKKEFLVNRVVYIYQK